MKKTIIALALLLPSIATAQAISGQPYVAVHGEAKMEVVPDIFPLDITIKEISKDLANTQAAVESISRSIVELATSQGVPEEDLTVGNLNISPELEYDEKTEKQVFEGNSYEREIKIRFNTLDALRNFLAKIPAAKQIQVDTGNFQYSKTDAAKRSLLATAIKNARTTAEEMAQGAGRRLGPVHTISNQGFSLRYSESQSLDTVTVVGTALLAPGTVILKEGRITLDQDVYIVYSLTD